MFDGDRLNRGPYFHGLFVRETLLQRPIKAGSAHGGQLTHPLDTQATLQRHHFPHLVVDAVPPEPPLGWRRALIFCKAPLKKSTSIVFSASSRFAWCSCLRSDAACELASGSSWPGSTASKRSRHL